MALKLKALLASLDTLPKELHELYEKTDNGYVLVGLEDGGGEEYKKKITEFRDSNVLLAKERDEWKGKASELGKMDQAKYQKALQALEKLESEEERLLLKEGKFDEAFARRSHAMKSSYEERLAALQTAVKERDEKIGHAREELAVLKIDAGVGRIIEEKKLRPARGALTDILNRTRTIFSINEEGKMVPRPGHFGSDGNPITMEGFVEVLTKDAGHLFEKSAGSGAKGSTDVDPTDGKVRIDMKDPRVFGANLDAIAKGKAVDLNAAAR